MKLSIVIVSWNVKEDLIHCLESLYENPPSKPFGVIVVDNASSDGTTETLKNFPQVTTITNNKNRGFAAANNQGIKASKGQYILLLNPDTLVHQNSLDTLVDFMDDNPDVGACGPKLLNEDGTVQRSVRQFPTFRAALYQHTILRPLTIFRGQYRKWMMTDFSYDHQKQVCQLMGAALLIRRSVTEQVGLMDENFFMYYEEVDLCLRIKLAGWRIMFIPQAVITHSGGQSAKQMPVEKRVMLLRSLLTFFRKNHGQPRTKLFSIIFKPLVLLRHLFHLLRDTIKYFFALILFNRYRQTKCANKIKNSVLFLGKYSWQLLFKT